MVLRKPLLIIATILALLVVLADVGSALFLDTGKGSDLASPGIGISYMALVDGALFVTLLFLALSVIVSARIMGMIFGLSNFIIFLLMFISSIIMIFTAILKLTMMVVLFLAVPFGTLAYLAGFGDFDTGAARATLSVLLTLKLGIAFCLIFSHPSYLKIKSLVFLVLCSLLVNFIVLILHAIVPGILVSITDAVAAIVVAIIGAIWAIWKTIGAIPSAIKGLRVDRHMLGG